jgi:hypothetical protein
MANEAEAAVEWRRGELLQSGFPPELAERVAGDQRYDLGELIKLVGEGCSPALAVRILSPVDGGELAEARE